MPCFDVHDHRHALKQLKDTGATSLWENRKDVACPVCDAPFDRLFTTERREPRSRRTTVRASVSSVTRARSLVPSLIFLSIHPPGSNPDSVVDRGIHARRRIVDIPFRPCSAREPRNGDGRAQDVPERHPYPDPPVSPQPATKTR